MATEGKGQNKTRFLQDLFRKDPDINEKAAVDAWKKAGNEGTISGSLFYTTKSALNKQAEEGSDSGPQAGTPRPAAKPARPKASDAGLTPPATAKERKPRTDDRERMLADVEGDIDRIIFKLMVIGGMEEIEEELPVGPAYRDAQPRRVTDPGRGEVGPGRSGRSPDSFAA